MKTYKIRCDNDAWLALPSNASVVDHEDTDENHYVFVEVTGNYTRFEQQMDTNPGVYGYEVVEESE